MPDELSNAAAELQIKDIEGLTAKVTFALPFCLYLEDGVYQIAREGWTASIQLVRVDQTRVDPRLGIEQTTGTELVRDRYGRLRFSRVNVDLPGRPIIENELRRRVEAGEMQAKEGILQVTLTVADVISNFRDVAFQEAVDAVNRLIEVYRHVTDEFHVRRIPSEEIFQADIQWYQNDEPLGGTYQMSFGHGITPEPRTFNPQTLESLQSWLISTKPVPTVFELFSDAKDRLDRGEYRLAVVDARTALEVFVDELLFGYFTITNTSLEDACQILDVEHRKVQTVEEALQRALINRKLGHALKQVLDLDLHDGHPELWQRWLKAKELREGAAHQGRDVGRTDAVASVNAMGEIIEKTKEALQHITWLPDQSVKPWGP